MDGVVVLRLIDSNTGYIAMADILYQLWLNYNTMDENAEKKMPVITENIFGNAGGEVEAIDANK